MRMRFLATSYRLFAICCLFAVACTMPEVKLGDQLAEKGDWDGAVAAYRGALKKGPFDEDVKQRLEQAKIHAAERHYAEGRQHLKENRVPEAVHAFKQALSLDPRAAVAANNLAWDYLERGGNLDRALQLAQTAKAELPDEAAVNDTLGWVYYKRDLPGPAIEHLRAAVEQSPTSPARRYRLGLAYLKNGDTTEARQTLQRVLTLDPDFAAAEDVRQALASLDN